MARCTSEARCSSEDAEGARGRARRTTVLVVDDDACLRETTALALQLEGYATLQAADGLDALLSLRTGDLPDAIVLDLEMPVMAGWELRAALLADPALARIPIVAVSSSPRPIDAARRLPKPFGLEDLLRAIREVAGEPRRG